MATIELAEIFDQFILAGKFPATITTTCSADEVAIAMAAWRPDLAHVLTSRRLARLMANHTWIDRYCITDRNDPSRRYAYSINGEWVADVREAAVARQAASAKPHDDGGL